MIQRFKKNIIMVGHIFFLPTFYIGSVLIAHGQIVNPLQFSNPLEIAIRILVALIAIGSALIGLVMAIYGLSMVMAMGKPERISAVRASAIPLAIGFTLFFFGPEITNIVSSTVQTVLGGSA